MAKKERKVKLKRNIINGFYETKDRKVTRMIFKKKIKKDEEIFSKVQNLSFCEILMLEALIDIDIIDLKGNKKELTFEKMKKIILHDINCI